MDSLTQVALGGAVGYAVLGNQVGRKAAIYGAILGTLPDLDVFLPYGGEVESFTYHRGFSHSILVHLLASPVIAWLILKIHPYTVEFKTRWTALVFLCLSTHAVLDSLTVYGTQLMWPLTEYPVGVSSLFIIDPLYTLPLLIAWISALIMKQHTRRAQLTNFIGLGISSVYIVWSLSAKVYIDQKIETALAQQDIDYSVYISTPAPLTTFLWRTVVVENSKGNSSAYYEVYASIFDAPEDVSVTKYISQTDLLKNIESQWGIERLQWFTKGAYAISEEDNKVILSDLRMGAQCYYVFNFVVGEIQQEGVVVSDYARHSARPSLDKVGTIFDRIWDPSIQLSPTECNNKLLQESE